MTRNNIIRFVNIIYIHMTKSPVVIHLVLKTRVNKQNKPSFSLKIPKVKTLCQDSQASATNYMHLLGFIFLEGGSWALPMEREWAPYIPNPYYINGLWSLNTD